MNPPKLIKALEVPACRCDDARLSLMCCLLLKFGGQQTETGCRVNIPTDWSNNFYLSLPENWTQFGETPTHLLGMSVCWDAPAGNVIAWVLNPDINPDQ